MYEKNPAESDQGGEKGRKAPRRHLGCVADRAAKQGERCGYSIRLVVVQGRHFGHGKVAVAIGHAARQRHLEGDLTQRARYVQHLLIVHVRCVMAQGERDAGGVKARRNGQAIAPGDRVDFGKARIAATGCNGQHLRDFHPIADKLRTANAAARIEPPGIDGVQAINVEGVNGLLIDGVYRIARIFPAGRKQDFVTINEAVRDGCSNRWIAVSDARDGLCRCKGFGE